MHREALRYRDRGGQGGAGAGLHVLYKRAVVEARPQFIAAGIDLGACMGYLAEGFKQPFVFDKPRVLQCVRDIADVRLRYALCPDLVAVFIQIVDRGDLENAVRQRHDRGEIVLIQRQRVARRHPREARENNAERRDEHEVHHAAEAAGAGFPALAHRAVIPLGHLVAGVVVVLVAVFIYEEIVHRGETAGFVLRGGFLRLLLRLRRGLCAGLARLSGFLLRILIVNAEYLIYLFNIVRHCFPPHMGIGMARNSS